jgi:hypothetical protein
MMIEGIILASIIFHVYYIKQKDGLRDISLSKSCNSVVHLNLTRSETSLSPWVKPFHLLTTISNIIHASRAKFGVNNDI